MFLNQLKDGTINIPHSKIDYFSKIRIERAVEQNEIKNGAIPKRDIDYAKHKEIIVSKIQKKLEERWKFKTQMDL